MFDVVVVGAGLSGLQAAYSAQQAGLSVAVVEARDRVGGKVFSVPLASGRGFADLGAAWINLDTQKRISQYAKRFNMKVVEQRIVGKAVMQVSKQERIEFPFGITPDVSCRQRDYFTCYSPPCSLDSCTSKIYHFLPANSYIKLVLTRRKGRPGAYP